MTNIDTVLSEEQTSDSRPDLFDKYLNKPVVMELGSVGNPVSSGQLEGYDKDFVYLVFFSQHKVGLERYLSAQITDLEQNPHLDLLHDDSIKYRLNSKSINKNQIASIQFKKDVIWHFGAIRKK